MAETIPSVSVTSHKDVQVVEFTNNRILDEANIADIGQSLAVLIDEAASPKRLLDFSSVDHLSSAALGMLSSWNSSSRTNSMFVTSGCWPCARTSVRRPHARA